MKEAKDAGIVSILFGAGVGASTDAVGSPAPDNYWWITKAQRYLKKPLPLDASNIVQPENNLPLKGTLTSNTTNSKDGNYSLTLTLPKNHNATSYEILENNKMVKSDSLTNSSTSIKEDFKNKTDGTYAYEVILKNKNGTSKTSKITISVKRESTEKPTPETNFWKADVNYKVGDVVSYNNKKYKCIQQHLSLNGWEPTNVPALWSQN